jgi:hypothetical protein
MFGIAESVWWCDGSGEDYECVLLGSAQHRAGTFNLYEFPLCRGCPATGCSPIGDRMDTSI